MKASHRLIAPAAAVILIASTAAPAEANARTFQDRRGDAPRAIDIRKVRVTHAPKRVVVRVKQRRHRIGNAIAIYLDTKRKNRGPEFRLTAWYASEYRMFRMKRWQQRGKRVKCGRYKLRMRPNGVSRAVIHRKCLGTPNRVRVAVKTKRGGPRSDWARAKHRWLGWVKR